MTTSPNSTMVFCATFPWSCDLNQNHVTLLKTWVTPSGYPCCQKSNLYLLDVRVPGASAHGCMGYACVGISPKRDIWPCFSQIQHSLHVSPLRICNPTHHGHSLTLVPCLHPEPHPAL